MRRLSFRPWLLAPALWALSFATATPAAALPRGELPPPSGWQGVLGEPGSGVAREPTGAVDRRALSVPPARLPKTAEDDKALADLELIFARYRRATAVAADTLAIVTVVEAERGRGKLQKQLDTEIAAHKAKALQLREAAIARYDGFLKQNPSDPSWTPEILFRLAELHFEADNERFARAESEYEKALLAFEDRKDKKQTDVPPEPPKVDYSRSVALLHDLNARFPGYVHADAALYLMAILRFEEERFDESRQTMLALVCADRYGVPGPDGSGVVPARNFRAGDYNGCNPRKPGSKYIAETWLRIGEIHYDLDEMRPALEAYTEAARDTQGPYFDEATIRIAWTLYLQRDFPGAAARLDEYVRLAESMKAAGDDSAMALRDDAIRYIAKCYIEDDWDLDGNPDPAVGFVRLERDYKARGGEKHVPEIYAALGDLYAFQTDFKLAIKIWDAALARWPTAAAAPLLQKKILDAYVALGDKNGARTARDALANNFLRGTPWFYANEADTEAIDGAMKLVEEALVASAVERHAYAQSLRAAGDPRAEEEYKKAAAAYAAYLLRYPDTPSSYQYRYDYAESLYYSGQYLEAAREYITVRDSNTAASRQVDAAEGVVFSLEAYVEGEQKAGKLTLPDMPKQDAVKPPFDPKPIPEALVALQSAYDKLVAIKPDAKAAGSLAFKSGAISQRYFHWDEAETRFTRVIDDYCGENVAINAGFSIIDGKVIRGDLKAAQEWTEKLLQKGCGDAEQSEKFAGDLKTLGNAVRFQEANQLFEAGEFEAAADRYTALVDQAPKDPNADRALNNAAVAYEKIGRFGSASKTYERIYKQYPDSEFADDALLRSGLNHVRFFEFDDAVASYLVLAQDERYKDSEHRLLALKNAADLLDNLQQYKKSSDLFVRYAAKTADPKEAADASFRAASVLGKTDDHKAAETAFVAFLGKFGADPTQAAKSVEAHLRIGEARAARGDRKGAETAYRECVALYTARGLQAASDAADFPSEAQFLLSEYSLSDLLDFKLNGTGKKFADSAKVLFDKVVAASKSYDSVFPYRRIEWVLAAMFRRGYAFEVTAIKIREAPVPRELKEYSEPWFAYKDIVETEASKFEAKAIQLYEETIKRGKEYGVASEWTRKALERMNIYKPDQYPLLHDASVDLQLEDRRR
ncbi:tetratricopeptide repeat protein [Nannocystis punicea]|uniref:Tetratricopeptide repeat protein n=1 Tax=Nannocystis punicea TaxID=2995304 RepID=A0ABY7H829_9BACT|nr:tetratricopeptide repeat protein [Nannocystis poenicansa]WAS95430.1 tetratricopeptide repeat protein [Nannocystis poenicansa]